MRRSKVKKKQNSTAQKKTNLQKRIEIEKRFEIIQNEFDLGLTEKPNELTMDVSYAIRLADQFSMGVALRYLRSDLRIQSVDDTAKAASSYAVDISAFFQGEEQRYGDIDGRWRAGAIIQNLGPKIKYDDAGQESFIPTNLRLGAGLDILFDDDNILGFYTEFSKLLVPTPFGIYDSNQNLLGYKQPDIDFINGIFRFYKTNL